MRMSYTFREHTADIRMDVESRSSRGLFKQSLSGMFKFLKPALRKERVRRSVIVRSPDAAALLVEFLNEALSLAHAKKEAYTSVTFETLSDTELRATLSGRRASSFGEDIKAVTYHEARVECDAAGVWRAHVVFDI